MGAYLSEPVVDKISTDESSEELKLSYGSSCMQGWRVSQEDAHNSILDFDKDTSFFSVYDGHGGPEVATYCALHLPEFLKNTQAYKDGNIEQALVDAYLEFDQHLTKPEVIKELKLIAGTTDKKDENQSDEEPDEMSSLYEEATMSIEELVMRYGRSKCKAADVEAGDSKDSSGKNRSAASSSRGKKDRSQSADSPKTVTTDSEKEDSESSVPSESVCNVPASSVDDKSVTEPDGCLSSKMLSATSNNNSESSDDGKHSASEKSDENSVGEQGDCKNEKKESNGTIENGSHNTEPQSTKEERIITSSKGKGVGKGLSNTIRKPVEKTPEELELEKREAERIAKRLERKQSLRNKSGDELYRSMVTNDEEDTDEDGDDEEDEDFEGEGSSTSGDGDEDVHDEQEEEDEDDDEEEGEEEEDSEEVTATANKFSMNLKEEPGSDSGCTAVVAVLRGNQLFVANAGDSRCVLSRGGQAVPLSADHKPEDEAEKIRIERAGGVVTGDGRVNGGLNLSRAIGDHAYKQNSELDSREQMITALPDIQAVTLEEGDEFVVLACDGIWNSKTNQQVVDFVRPRLLAKKQSLSQICEELFDECLAPNTMGDGTGCDNMTAMIVRLDRFLPQFWHQKSPTAADGDSVSAEATTGQPIKRPLNHDTSAEENTDGSRLHDQNEADRSKEKRQRVEEENQVADETVGSKEI